MGNANRDRLGKQYERRTLRISKSTVLAESTYNLLVHPSVHEEAILVRLLTNFCHLLVKRTFASGA